MVSHWTDKISSSLCTRPYCAFPGPIYYSIYGSLGSGHPEWRYQISLVSGSLHSLFSLAAIPPIGNVSFLFRIHSNITLLEMCAMSILSKIVSLLVISMSLIIYVIISPYHHNIYYMTIYIDLLSFFGYPKYNLLDRGNFISFINGSIFRVWHKVLAQ